MDHDARETGQLPYPGTGLHAHDEQGICGLLGHEEARSKGGRDAKNHGLKRVDYAANRPGRVPFQPVANEDACRTPFAQRLLNERLQRVLGLRIQL